MKFTDKIKLQKPENGEFYSVEVFNTNSDLIDKAFENFETDPIDVLEKLKTVDGSGSGLDADFLDGKDSTAFAASDHKHEMGDINNLKLTAENTTVKDTDNNFPIKTVEGALKELANEDKTLQINIDNNKKEVDKEITDLKQSVSSGKQLIATAVTGKDVPTNGSDSFQKMADNIDSIIVRSPIAEDEIGVVQWEDGSYKGFKEISYFRALKDISYRQLKWFELNTFSDLFDIDENKNIYCSYLESRYAAESIVKKVNLQGVVSWIFEGESYVKNIKLDNEKNVYILHKSGFITKLNNNGELQWTKEITPGNDSIAHFTLDNKGYLYAAKYTSNSSDESSVYKIDTSNGEIVKTTSFNLNERGYQIKIGKDGYLYTFFTTKYIKSDLEFNKISEYKGGGSGIFELYIDKKSIMTFMSSTSIVRRDKDGSQTWYKDLSGSMQGMSVNEAGGIYANDTTRLYRLNINGDIEENISIGGTHRMSRILDPNLIFMSSGSSTNRKDMRVYQDNIEAVESVVLKTNFQTI